ncbi:MAG: hypothetical protein Q9227_009170 [Pyrenula ochraceoflavens]
MIVIIGGGAVIFAVRKRERNIFERQRRRMSVYPHPRLSVGSDNYPNIPQPTGNLRKSIRVPTGVDWDRWDAEQIDGSQSLEQARRQDDDLDFELTPRKKRRHLRNSLLVPKTRRQKRIESALPLGSVRRSPLSAITENSNTESSPKPAVYELAESTTPKRTPERDEKENLQPSSSAWPLPVPRSNSDNASTSSTKANRPRSNSAGYNLFPRAKRSMSMSSQVTVATTVEQELPPLPPIGSFDPIITPLDPLWLTRNDSKQNRRRSRQSAEAFATASKDTEPEHAGSRSMPSLRSKQNVVNLNAQGLQSYENSFSRNEKSDVKMGSPVGKSTQFSSRPPLVTAKSVHGSIRDQPFTIHQGQPTESASQIRDHGLRFGSQWAPVNGNPSMNKPDLPSPAKEKSQPHVDQRHSMYETPNAVATLSTVSEASGSSRSPVHMSARPNSFAGYSPFQWDSTQLKRDMPSPDESPQRMGHRRQNCVRIPNVPMPDPVVPTSQQQIHRPPVRRDSIIRIPGLTLLDEPTSSPPPPPAQEPEIAHHPIFSNRPVLSPMPRRPTLQSTHGNESSVFDSPSPYKPTSPNIFAQAASLDAKISPPNQGQNFWPPVPARHPSRRRPDQPVSPTLNRRPSKLLRLNENLGRRDESESPILPSPTISSEDLFSPSAPTVLRRFDHYYPAYPNPYLPVHIHHPPWDSSSKPPPRRRPSLLGPRPQPAPNASTSTIHASPSVLAGTRSAPAVPTISTSTDRRAESPTIPAIYSHVHPPDTSFHQQHPRSRNASPQRSERKGTVSPRRSIVLSTAAMLRRMDSDNASETSSTSTVMTATTNATAAMTARDLHKGPVAAYQSLFTKQEGDFITSGGTNGKEHDTGNTTSYGILAQQALPTFTGPIMSPPLPSTSIAGSTAVPPPAAPQTTTNTSPTGSITLYSRPGAESSISTTASLLPTSSPALRSSNVIPSPPHPTIITQSQTRPHSPAKPQTTKPATSTTGYLTPLAPTSTRLNIPPSLTTHHTSADRDQRSPSILSSGTAAPSEWEDISIHGGHTTEGESESEIDYDDDDACPGPAVPQFSSSRIKEQEGEHSENRKRSFSFSPSLRSSIISHLTHNSKHDENNDENENNPPPSPPQRHHTRTLTTTTDSSVNSNRHISWHSATPSLTAPPSPPRKSSKHAPELSSHARLSFEEGRRVNEALRQQSKKKKRREGMVSPKGKELGLGLGLGLEVEGIGGGDTARRSVGERTSTSGESGFWGRFERKGF